jgi:hypothetical protein
MFVQRATPMTDDFAQKARIVALNLKPTLDKKQS